MPAKKLLWLLPLLILAACGSGENVNRYNGSEVSPAAAVDQVADHEKINAGVTAITSPDRKMIRTADFHVKVADVLDAVTRLEKKVKSVGGIVEESHIDNSSGEVKTISYKPDSLKQVQVYHTTAQLTLRIPAPMLDSVAEMVPEVAKFVESRRLNQQDVTLRYLSNQLLGKPDDAHGSVSKAVQLAADTRDIIEIQRSQDARKEQSVNRQIENLRLMDNVTYATLSISFSQPDQSYVQTIVNPDYVMRVPFGARCSTALQGGLDLMSGVIVGLLTIWPLLLILTVGLLAWFAIVRRRDRIYSAGGRQG